MTLGLVVLVLLGQEPAVAGGQEVLERLACAPISATELPAAALRIVGSADHGRITFGPGDAVVVNAGSEQGMKKGRSITSAGTCDNHAGVARLHADQHSHRAGRVTIVDTKDYASIAGSAARATAAA
jgi:hypothetical protein